MECSGDTGVEPGIGDRGEGEGVRGRVVDGTIYEVCGDRGEGIDVVSCLVSVIGSVKLRDRGGMECYERVLLASGGKGWIVAPSLAEKGDSGGDLPKGEGESERQHFHT